MINITYDFIYNNMYKYKYYYIVRKVNIIKLKNFEPTATIRACITSKRSGTYIELEETEVSSMMNYY